MKLPTQPSTGVLRNNCTEGHFEHFEETSRHEFILKKFEHKRQQFLYKKCFLDVFQGILENFQTSYISNGIHFFFEHIEIYLHWLFLKYLFSDFGKNLWLTGEFTYFLCRLKILTCLYVMLWPTKMCQILVITSWKKVHEISRASVEKVQLN